MFGWRRKNDGFEWRKYVRTTIKVRREERARKIDEIKQAAASGAKSGARHGFSALRDASAAGGRSVLAAVRRLWARIRGAAIWTFQTLKTAVSDYRSGAPNGGRRWRLPSISVSLSASAKIAGMFGVLGLLAGISAYLQYRQSGLDWSAVLAGLVAVALAGLAMAPWLRRAGKQSIAALRSTRLPPRLPSMATPRPSARAMGGIAAALVVAVGSWWLWQSGRVQAASSAVVSVMPSLPGWPSLPSLPTFASLPSITGLPDISGRARAISGDTIRIDGRLIRLSGIEAPEVIQMCKDRRRRNWRCGRRARAALRQLVRRRKTECTSVSEIDGGRLQATCTVGGEDLAAQMVRKGYAFSEGGLLTSYASDETAAKDALRGVWRGEALRPSEFRAKRWQLASRSAPDGCPIKGRVVRKTKVYVLPWALDYRQVRVRAKLGERWFCSEADATNAGFRPSTTG